MSSWQSCQGKRVLAALLNIGWDFDPDTQGRVPYRVLVHPKLPRYIWPFQQTDELGPVALSRIAAYTGLQPEDL